MNPGEEWEGVDGGVDEGRRDEGGREGHFSATGD